MVVCDTPVCPAVLDITVLMPHDLIRFRTTYLSVFRPALGRPKRAKLRDRTTLQERMDEEKPELDLTPAPSTTSWTKQLSPCPTFHPTADEFTDPVAYISSIHDQVERHGMVKIVPPVLPEPVAQDFTRSRMPVRQQVIRKMPWSDWDAVRAWPGQPKTLSGFTKVADGVSSKVFKTTLAMPASTVEVMLLSLPDHPPLHFSPSLALTAASVMYDWSSLRTRKPP